MNVHSHPAAPRVSRLAGCLAIALGVGAASAASPIPGHATSTPRGPVTRQVFSCDDASLRQAITSAMDGDTVAMPAGCSLITLDSGEIPILVDKLQLVGPGADAFTIDGGQTSGFYNRVFRHHGTGTLSISGMTISGASTNNSLDPNGGCIDSDGTVALDHAVVKNCYMQADTGLNAQGGAIYAKLGVELHSSTVSENAANAVLGFTSGGGIFSNGYFLAESSTVSDNFAEGSGFGGGVYAVNGDVEIKSSTVSGNKALNGAGVFVGYKGTTALADIQNSTISGNEAGVWAGGLMVASGAQSLEIRSSTIADNRVPAGSFGGAYLAGVVAMDSTIIAGNTVSDGLQASDLGGAAGTTVSGGNNLIRASSLPVPGDTLTVDPMLGPLQDNGGYTWTHALSAMSPAIDHGSNVGGYRVDQRLHDVQGHPFSRVVGGGADIGAFEYDDQVFADGFDPT